MAALSTKQIEALEWLRDEGPWITSWWGGRPFTGWNPKMSTSTFNSLRKRKLIKMSFKQMYEREVKILGVGLRALEEQKKK